MENTQIFFFFDILIVVHSTLYDDMKSYEIFLESIVMFLTFNSSWCHGDDIVMTRCHGDDN